MTSDAAGDFSGGVAATAEYEEVLGRLSSLITQKVRAHSGNRGNQWDLMAHYLKVRSFTPSLDAPSSGESRYIVTG